MVDNAWFRLMIRGIGVLLLGLSVPSLFSFVGMIGSILGMDTGYRDYVSWTYGGYILAGVAQIAFGIYLLFFAEGLIRRCLSDTIGRCPMCQYDLKGQRNGKCPECGTDMGPAPAAPGNPTSQVPPTA